MVALNGLPSPITCPACGGALWETAEEGVVRYACHVGHQYAPDSLLAEHGEAVEQALWSAVRALEQHAELRQRMSKRARDAGMAKVGEGFAEDSSNYHLQAQHIRQLLFGQRDRVAPDPARPLEGPGAVDWRAPPGTHGEEDEEEARAGAPCREGPSPDAGRAKADGIASRSAVAARCGPAARMAARSRSSASAPRPAASRRSPRSCAPAARRSTSPSSSSSTSRPTTRARWCRCSPSRPR